MIAQHKVRLLLTSPVETLKVTFAGSNRNASSACSTRGNPSVLVEPSLLFRSIRVWPVRVCTSRALASMRVHAAQSRTLCSR